MTALWGACRPACEAGEETSAFLRRRRFDPDELRELVDVRELPAASAYPWPRWWPRSWVSGWRLVLPAYTPAGVLASVHARFVLPELPAGAPKTRWPYGCEAGGLLFADWAGLRLLRGDAELCAELAGVLVAEGFTDTLRAALTVARARRPIAVLGAAAGGFTALSRVALPAGMPVFAATDRDAAGDRYALELSRALRPRPVRRFPLDLWSNDAPGL